MRKKCQMKKNKVIKYEKESQPFTGQMLQNSEKRMDI